MIGKIKEFGEIVLRLAAVFSMEIYSYERIAEFSEQNDKLVVFLDKIT